LSRINQIYGRAHAQLSQLPAMLQRVLPALEAMSTELTQKRAVPLPTGLSTECSLSVNALQYTLTNNCAPMLAVWAKLTDSTVNATFAASVDSVCNSSCPAQLQAAIQSVQVNCSASVVELNRLHDYLLSVTQFSRLFCLSDISAPRCLPRVRLSLLSYIAQLGSRNDTLQAVSTAVLDTVCVPCFVKFIRLFGEFSRALDDITMGDLVFASNLVCLKDFLVDQPATAIYCVNEFSAAMNATATAVTQSTLTVACRTNCINKFTYVLGAVAERLPTTPPPTTDAPTGNGTAVPTGSSANSMSTEYNAFRLLSTMCHRDNTSQMCLPRVLNVLNATDGGISGLMQNGLSFPPECAGLATPGTAVCTAECAATISRLTSIGCCFNDFVIMLSLSSGVSVSFIQLAISAICQVTVPKACTSIVPTVQFLLKLSNIKSAWLTISANRITFIVLLKKDLAAAFAMSTLDIDIIYDNMNQTFNITAHPNTDAERQLLLVRTKADLSLTWVNGDAAVSVFAEISSGASVDSLDVQQTPTETTTSAVPTPAVPTPAAPTPDVPTPTPAAPTPAVPTPTPAAPTLAAPTPAVPTPVNALVSSSNGGSNNDGIIAIAVIVPLLIIAFCAAIILLFVFWKRKMFWFSATSKNNNNNTAELSTVVASSTNHQNIPLSTNNVPKQTLFGKAVVDLNFKGWLIPFNEISMEQEVGRGAFGVVYKGQWRGTSVAVKQILAEEMNEKEIKAFIAEISLMHSLRPHGNKKEVKKKKKMDKRFFFFLV
jgi:hypothetical protein